MPGRGHRISARADGSTHGGLPPLGRALAELGDRSQPMALAFATRFRVRTVVLCITIAGSLTGVCRYHRPVTMDCDQGSHRTLATRLITPVISGERHRCSCSDSGGVPSRCRCSWFDGCGVSSAGAQAH
ncbi:MAG: TMEM165/GDT1 family protein [Propionibacteriales bacterium]|nr:TMEM165/GDT1 family protein [Propionibacteriales bacterium]